MRKTDKKTQKTETLICPHIRGWVGDSKEYDKF